MRATLAGISQIFFLSNPWSGLAFLLAVLWASPVMVIGMLLGVSSANLTARLAGFSISDIEQGLFGYNAGLVGLLLGLCYEPSLLLALGIVSGAIACTLLFQGLRSVWAIPLFTAPFNLLMLPWLFLTQTTPLDLPVDPIPLLSGVSQVLFVSDPISAVVVTLVLLLQGVPFLLWALGGSLVGIVAGILFGLDPGSLTFGIAGFNPVLAAIALYHHQLSWRWILAGMLLAATAGAGLMAAGLPALTAPFVISCWLILLLERRRRTHLAG
ncbi:urea transporter [Nitrincola sp. MINF-07-Sa-05]|uniref:urea transporter n=1 Tax=Nitrincola salilacus TaxID=3400273 RepID=UPI003917FA3F